MGRQHHEGCCQGRYFGESRCGIPAAVYAWDFRSVRRNPQGSLKVIGEQTGPGEQCRRSTPLYPGWTVSSTPHASSDLIRKVSQGLLEMPPVGSNDLRWGIATNYQSVDGLYKKLKMGPYAYLRDWTIKGFIEKYWPFLLLTFIGVILLALYAFYLARLTQRRSKQLSKAFVSQRKLQQKNGNVWENAHPTKGMGHRAAIFYLCSWSAAAVDNATASFARIDST